MTDIPVDRGPAERAEKAAAAVEVEREITKRAIVESVTAVLLVLLYMGWALLRDRDPGVIALDGSADDWD